MDSQEPHPLTFPQQIAKIMGSVLETLVKRHEDQSGNELPHRRK